MPDIIFVSHTGIKGGAGKFNQAFLHVLEESSLSCELVGKVRRYNFKGRILEKNTFDGCVFPNYSGVRKRAKFFFLTKLIFNFIPNLIKLNQFMKIRRCSTLILSSSIMIPYVFMLKLINKELKIVILIQEDLCLDGIFGGVCRIALKGVRTVGITEVWCKYAKMRGVDSVLLRNPFVEKDSSITALPLDSSKYDLLYCGGGNDIKGFSLLLNALSNIHHRNITILMLGAYTENDLNRINDIYNQTCHRVEFDVAGLVEDISTYICQSKILVIPIEAPHFCRPAIEAGFYGRSFIIPDFLGLDDFVRGDNCLKFRSNDPSSLKLIIEEALDNDTLVKSVSKANAKFVSEFVRSNNFSDTVQRLIS